MKPAFSIGCLLKLSILEIFLPSCWCSQTATPLLLCHLLSPFSCLCLVYSWNYYGWISIIALIFCSSDLQTGCDGSCAVVAGSSSISCAIASPHLLMKIWYPREWKNTLRSLGGNCQNYLAESAHFHLDGVCSSCPMSTQSECCPLSCQLTTNARK